MARLILHSARRPPTLLPTRSGERRNPHAPAAHSPPQPSPTRPGIPAGGPGAACCPRLSLAPRAWAPPSWEPLPCLADEAGLGGEPTAPGAAGSPHRCYAVRRPLKTPGHEVKDGEPSTKRKLGSRFNKQENRFNVKASRREKRSLVLRAAAGGTRRLEPAARQAGLRGDSPLPPPSRGQLHGCEQRSDVNGTFSRST